MIVRSEKYMAVPPGATIKEQLICRGMSQKEFAARMDMSEKHISRLINGEVQLTHDVAVRLEIVLGVPAKFWNNLESIYREQLIKIEAEKSMEADEMMAKQLPYVEMTKLGWVQETGNTKERVAYLRKYFEVVQLSILENSLVTNIACRRLVPTEKSDLALMAWVQEAKIQARNIETETLNIKGLKTSLHEINNLTALSFEDYCPKLKRVLAENGIALVILPRLKGSSIYGASFMEKNKIVIVLASEEDDETKFWFNLFHELGHVMLGHLDRCGGLTHKDEEDADKWANSNYLRQGKA